MIKKYQQSWTTIFKCNVHDYLCHSASQHGSLKSVRTWQGLFAKGGFGYSLLPLGLIGGGAEFPAEVISRYTFQQIFQKITLEIKKNARKVVS